MDPQLGKSAHSLNNSTQMGDSPTHQDLDIKSASTSRSNKSLLVLLFLGSALIFISLGYLLGTRPWKEARNEPGDPTNTQQAFNDSAQQPDWLTYKNDNPPYTISYPSDWTIDTSKAAMQPNTGAALILEKDNYQLNIQWPDGYSPGGCIFSDSPDFNNLPLPQYSLCPGEYIEFEGSSEQIYRRLKSPEQGEDYATKQMVNRWSVYTKESVGNNYVGVPPISYLAPESYEQTMIATLDQIIASLTVLDSTTSHYFPEIGLTMQVPNELYVFERHSTQPPRQENEPFTLYIQNYNEENPTPTMEASFQMYFLFKKDQNFSPEEQLAFARTTLNPDSMEDLTVDGHTLLRGQVAGSRNRFYAGTITNEGLLEIFISEPTPENERLAYDIISTFQFD